MRQKGLIYVITGDKGAGKSTVCALVAQKARDAGLTVAGIITGRGTDDDPPSVRWVTDLRSTERHLFGSRRSGEEHASTPAGPNSRSSAIQSPVSDPLIPGWDLDPRVFAWANAVLAHATPCDLLIIDEVGPLELTGGRGWVEALPALRSGAYGAALVVCRPGLVNELESQLGTMSTSTVEVTLENRDSVPAGVVAKVLAASW